MSLQYSFFDSMFEVKLPYIRSLFCIHLPNFSFMYYHHWPLIYQEYLLCTILIGY